MSDTSVVQGANLVLLNLWMTIFQTKVLQSTGFKEIMNEIDVLNVAALQLRMSFGYES